LQLPNGVQFRDPAVQEHLRQVVPSDWPGVITTLEKSDRDSSAKRNNYILTLTKRRPEPVNRMASYSGDVKRASKQYSMQDAAWAQETDSKILRNVIDKYSDDVTRDPYLSDSIKSRYYAAMGELAQRAEGDESLSSHEATNKKDLIKRSTLLPALIKICDGLDIIGETKNADSVDGMIRSITANEDSCQNCQRMSEGVSSLRSYLMSPKFHQDTTVQVGDVLMRLDEIEHAW